MLTPDLYMRTVCDIDLDALKATVGTTMHRRQDLALLDRVIGDLPGRYAIQAGRLRGTHDGDGTRWQRALLVPAGATI